MCINVKIKDYFANKNIKDFKNYKLYWEFYSASIKVKSCKSEEVLPSVFIHDNNEYNTPEEIGCIFNTFFTSLSSTSLSSDTDSDFFIDQTFLMLKRKNHLKPVKDKLNFVHVTENTVEKLINNLNESSGAGLSEIPSKVIKHCCLKFVPILTSIFNHCIDLGKLPIEWKSALVTPLYKNKGVLSDLNNYRGISVLPPISKIFEKLLAMQITIFLSMNNILFNGQHGFRRGHSCETALHELLTEINNNRDKKLTTLLLFIDFRKAFDLVDSKKLLRKLFHYGFDTKALNLIANYFADRFQSVKFDMINSVLLLLKLGVPQGSILGPLFFLIFINDLAFLLEIKCKMFADDTTLLDSDKNTEVLISRFKKLLEPLIDWCKFNKLDLNWSKTFFMFITNKREKLPTEILVDGNLVKIVQTFKLLGINIDNKLTFSEHVSITKKIINRKIFSIKRLFYLSTAAKIQFFKTFILPYFDYCSSLLLYYPKSSIVRLNNCFNLCLFKLFKFKPEIDYYNDLIGEIKDNDLIISEFSDKLQSYGLFTFQKRLMERFLLFTYSILNGSHFPENLKESVCLTLTSEVESEKSDSEPGPETDVLNLNLRSGVRKKCPIAATKYGHLTSTYFFGRLIEKFGGKSKFKIGYETFRTMIKDDYKKLLRCFLLNFLKFDYSIYVNHKKRSIKQRLKKK